MFKDICGVTRSFVNAWTGVVNNTRFIFAINKVGSKIVCLLTFVDLGLN
jgi:hypothetical protein